MEQKSLELRVGHPTVKGRSEQQRRHKDHQRHERLQDHS